MRHVKRDIIICAGIGIQTPEQVQVLARMDFDMVIVGTTLLHKMNAGVEDLGEYTRLLQDATFRGKSGRTYSLPIDATLLYGENHPAFRLYGRCSGRVRRKRWNVY